MERGQLDSFFDRNKDVHGNYTLSPHGVIRSVDKLRAIASFVRIVDRGSLKAAAVDLGVSLPSMGTTLAISP